MLPINPAQLSYDYNLRFDGNPYTASDGTPCASRVTLDVCLAEDISDVMPAGRRVAHSVLHLVPEVLQAPIGIFDVPELKVFGDLLAHVSLDILVGLQRGVDNSCMTVVASMNVDPLFRGQNISYMLMDSIRDTVCRSGSLIAISAAPTLQGYGPDAETAYAAGMASLERHWERYGFINCQNGLMMLPILPHTDEGRVARYAW